MVTVNINDIHAASSVSMKGKIWKFLKEQHYMGKLCDAVILCGDSKFMAHRFVLAAVSPYFRAQILGSFNNTTEDGVLLLALHDFSATSINLFLDLVYEEINVKDIDIDVVDFLELLDFLQLDIYFDTVLAVVRPMVSLDNCLSLFSISRRYNAKKLTKMLSTYIGAHMFDLIAGDHFKNISVDDFQSLLKWDTISCLPEHLLQKAENQLVSLKSGNRKQFIDDDKTIQQHCQKSTTKEEGSIIIMYCYTESFKTQIVGTDKLQNLNTVFPSIPDSIRVKEYFIFRRQLFSVITNDVFPAIIISRYDQTSKTHIEVFREKVTNLEEIMGIFPDLEDNYIYVVYYTTPEPDREIDYESDDWEDDINYISDVYILKISVDERIVLDRFVITAETHHHMETASVTYNGKENLLYIINEFKYIICWLDEKQVDSVRSIISPFPFDAEVLQTSLMHNDSIYYFQSNRQGPLRHRFGEEPRTTLSVLKSETLRMSFTTISQMQIHVDYIASLNVIPLSSRYILIFVRVYESKFFKLFKLDCSNNQLIEIDKSPQYEGDCRRTLLCVPSDIFE